MTTKTYEVTLKDSTIVTVPGAARAEENGSGIRIYDADDDILFYDDRTNVQSFRRVIDPGE